MDIKDAIYTRRSIRDYQDRKVEKSVIEQLIDAAIQAPNTMNTQPWAFAVIQDVDLLKKISDQAKQVMLGILENRPDTEEFRERLVNPDFDIFYNASTLILILAKPNMSIRPATDCTLAAENLMLMARNLGLGTCWAGLSQPYFYSDEAKQELGIPADYSVEAPIMVGYPNTEFTTIERNSPEVLFWK